ncbi:MAG: hypothetical protein JXR43_11415, partial [Burkholderiaceae bacterium]|nr:hypothetical protein [Burkholderiaceae bacterium]
SGTRLFMRITPLQEHAAPPVRWSATRSLAPWLLTALGVAMVLAAGPLTTAAAAIAGQIVQPQSYIRAVLGGGT